MYTGPLLVQRTFGEKNMWGLGLTYTDLLGEVLLIPLIRLFYYPTERCYLEMTIPVGIDVGYKLTDAWSFGLEQKLRGYTYRLTEDEAWDASVLRYREVQIGPHLDYRIYKKAHFRLSRGFDVSKGGIPRQEQRRQADSR